MPTLTYNTEEEQQARQQQIEAEAAAEAQRKKQAEREEAQRVAKTMTLGEVLRHMLDEVSAAGRPLLSTLLEAAPSAITATTTNTTAAAAAAPTSSIAPGAGSLLGLKVCAVCCQQMHDQ